MLPTKQNENLPATLRQLSQSEFVTTLTASNFKRTSELLPSTVKEATKQPPICDVIRVSGKGQVVRYVEFELIKMSSLISVGANLNNSQVEFIATQLVDLFPNESLADFKICFQRGCIGQYGDIFRMDGIVLRKWMEKYLDEKYTVLEDELMKSKDKPYEPAKSEGDGPGRRLFDEYANSLRMGTKIPGMTDADYEKYGQEKPARKPAISYPSSPKSVSDLIDLKTEYGRLHTDKLTGKVLEGSPTWEQFKKDRGC